MSSVENKRIMPTLQSVVLTARAFYKSKSEMPLYEHCLEVLKKARDVHVVENNAIKQHTRDPERAELNLRLAEIILYHILDYDQISAAGIPFPPVLYDSKIREELEIFCKLRDLDRSGASLDEYIPVLNNDKPAPLALLPRIVDVAVTHTTSQRTRDIVRHDGKTIFKLYDSDRDAKRSLENDAWAGEKIYAPLAEFFGYPSLAGDILLHSFKMNHSDIYGYVIEKMKESSLLERLETTQSVVRDLAKHLRQTLKVLGFNDAVVTPRMKKHDGKVMRKVLRKLLEDFDYIAKGQNIREEERQERCNEYISTVLPYSNISVLSDLVALRVVINELHGVKIDNMDEETKNKAIRVAMSAIKSNLYRLNTLPKVLYADCKPELKKKPETGYKAYHYDAVPADSVLERLLRFEIQLKTEEWHQIAEEGGAAHYYYLGGDRRFVDTLRNSYRNVIHMLRNGSSE